MKRVRQSILHAALALLTGVACGVGPESGSPAPGDRLDQVEIPASFTFQTNQPVTLTVAASEAVTQGRAALEVAREDGRVLFKGPIQANRPVALPMVIPSKDRSVQVTLRSGDSATTRSVSVASGQASARFE